MSPHTGTIEAINRLLPSNLQIADGCDVSLLWAALFRLYGEQVQGPKGHATWKDAAVAEVLRTRGVGACVAADDSALLDHIQCTGSTVELLPGNRFRIGGLHAAVSTDLRAAIRIAVGADGVTVPGDGYRLLTAEDHIRLGDEYFNGGQWTKVSGIAVGMLYGSASFHPCRRPTSGVGGLDGR